VLAGSGGWKLAIFKLRMPLHLREGAHVMSVQESTHTDGDAFIDRMRNAMALRVSHNRLDAIGRHFKLFGDFGDAHAIVEVIYNGADWHPCSAQHRSAALHSMFHFD
jgi:hypothetical protein